MHLYFNIVSIKNYQPSYHAMTNEKEIISYWLRQQYFYWIDIFAIFISFLSNYIYYITFLYKGHNWYYNARIWTSNNHKLKSTHFSIFSNGSIWPRFIIFYLKMDSVDIHIQKLKKNFIHVKSCWTYLSRVIDNKYSLS